jgi:hypothetical protein
VDEAQRAVAQRSAESTTKLGRMFVDLANKQTRHNLETLRALTNTVNWDRVFQIQSEYLRVSLARTARLTQGYFELGQAVMTSAVSDAQHQAKKAA